MMMRRPGISFRFFLPSILSLGTIWAMGEEDLPSPLQDLHTRGVQALEAGRFQKAQQAFEKILEAGGKIVSVHHNLGIAQQRQGRHKEALSQFREALRLDPNFAHSIAARGLSLLSIGEASRAIGELEGAVRASPAGTPIALTAG